MTDIIVKEKEIKNMIYEIRGKQVMLDSDLARVYGTLTGNINRAVKRNPKRFPKNFYFRLTEDEYNSLLCQNGIAKSQGGRQNTPYAFTEQGVAMLSGVLKTERAEEISVNIMNAFVEMRKFIFENRNLFLKLNNVESNLSMINNKLENHENNINELFNKFENNYELKEKLFFDGQIYDAYSLLINIIRKAKDKIIIIDNYIDKTILDILIYKNEEVEVEIWTKNIKSNLDIKKFNLQYPNVIIKKVNNFHDRFIILDNEELYHIGASLKDLGKKCFAISKMDKSNIDNLINKKSMI